MALRNTVKFQNIIIQIDFLVCFIQVYYTWILYRGIIIESAYLWSGLTV